MQNALNIIIQLLNLGLAAGEAYARFADIRDRLEAMKAEGREPTEAEWAELDAEVSALTARLEAADDRLNG
jgi:hypothetical protein